jgi:hypothetical protein
VQIAVSALLRTSSLGAEKFPPAEHCRYGTRDFATTELAPDYFWIADYPEISSRKTMSVRNDFDDG